MKCVELEAANLVGDEALALLECGLHLQNGQKVLVKAEVAGRMLAQYGNKLVKVKECEKDRLQGVWYEAVGGAAKKDGKPVKKDKPKAEAPKADSKEKADEGGSPVKAVAKDRSMAGKKKKVRTKKA